MQKIFNKKSFLIPFIIAIAILAIGAIIYFSDHKKVEAPVVTKNTEWKTYKNEKYGFEISYPSLIKLNQADDSIMLSHSISYKHSSPCDFKGDLPPLENFVDFSVSFNVSNSSMEEVKKNNFVWSYDQFSLGSLNGFKGERGIEGCGEYVYLFPISVGKILIIRRSYVAEFNPINLNYKIFLNLPGIISSEKSDLIFKQILSSIKFITPKVATTTKPIACTMDAKMCPDGTYVGRSGPNCEFVCPFTSGSEVKIGQNVTIQGVRITPLEVISDSRCAVGVTCVWAGTVSLKVTLQNGNKFEEAVLTLGQGYNSFGGLITTLTKVSPQKVAGKTILSSDYIFTLFVTPSL
ncbi:MAG: hypothetical protein WCW14_02300 [Candidatus Paceibacterota bacterium]|jgi:hypothetical protein